MKSRFGWVLAAATAVVVLQGFSACTTKKGSGDGGTPGTDGGPPLITTTALDSATTGKDYSFQMTGQGGTGALTWSISEASPELSWLTIDPQTGLLQSKAGLTPDEVEKAGLPISIQLEDSAHRTDIESFTLVVKCVAGKQFACRAPLDKVCANGINHCDSQGNPGNCDTAVDAGYSTSVEECGPGADDLTCGSCGTNASQCQGGACRCGAQAPCDTDGGYFCCPNDAPAHASCSNLTDAQHCGSCLKDCTVGIADSDHETATCDAGQCLNECQGTWRNCGSVPDNIGGPNGCPFNTAVDVANCGACGNACAQRSNTNLSCNGACVYSCAPNWADCDGASHDGSDTNGCETNLNDISHCGACGRVCTAPGNATATCTNGTCGIKCNSGLTNCDGACVNLQSDPFNCGHCGFECIDQAPFCTAGHCHM